MYFASDDFIKQCENLVETAEKTSNVEIVSVIAEKSGSYEDVNLRWALLGAFVFLGVAIFSPLQFHPSLLVFEAMLSAALFWWLSRHYPALRYLLTFEPRRIRQTKETAARAFCEENIHATRERTGLMLYYSKFEGRLVIMPDLGLDSKVPRSVWNIMALKVNSCRGMAAQQEAYLQMLRDLSTELAKFMPANDQDNPNEISNTPRFRP